MTLCSACWLSVLPPRQFCGVSGCCSALQCDAAMWYVLSTLPTRYLCGVLQCVAVCCSVLQCVAVCCSAMKRVAVRCSVAVCCFHAPASSHLSHVTQMNSSLCPRTQHPHLAVPQAKNPPGRYPCRFLKIRRGNTHFSKIDSKISGELASPQRKSLVVLNC